MTEHVVVAAVPTVDVADVLPLYAAVGWSTYTRDPDGLARALAGSSRVVLARDGERVVGLARVVSDGASVAYLQDVLVHPDARRAGLGARLVREAFEPYALVRQHVLLTDAEPGQRAFYAAAGFTEAHDHPADLRAFVRFGA